MRGWIAVGGLLLLNLAGCTGSASGGGDGGEGGTPPIVVTDTTGAIRGVVVDQAIVPIPDALIRVSVLGLEARTTETGGFGFSKVEPGLHFLEVSKPGYTSAQVSVEVEAGVEDPPVVKVQLVEDPTYNPYFEVLVREGFIECTTSFLVLCGAPNTLEPIMCSEFDVCYGNLTNDRFTWTDFFAPGAALIQSEMEWESSQAASPELSFSQEALTSGCPNTDLDTVLNGTSGPSPIYTQLWPPILEEYQISEECGVYFSVFSGEAVPGAIAGVTVEQTFRMYTHTFYGYTPPPGWRFVRDGDPPGPA